jgi:hypothetical protein
MKIVKQTLLFVALLGFFAAFLGAIKMADMVYHDLGIGALLT